MTSTSIGTRSSQEAWLNDAFTKMFAIMGGGLLLTAGAAVLTAAFPAFQAVLLATSLKWVVIFAPLVMVLIMGFGYEKLSANSLRTLFVAFSLVNGLSLSAIIVVYSVSSIVLSLIGASGLFLGMALYGYLTKKDLTSWGSILFVGLIVLLVVMIINLFLGSTLLEMAISVAGILLFMALTAFDVQKLRDQLWMEPTAEKAVIMGALTLYLDFLNLFLFVLRLFGVKTKD